MLVCGMEINYMKLLDIFYFGLRVFGFGVGVDIPGSTQMACGLVCGLDETGSNPVENKLLDAGRPHPSISS